MSKQHSPPPQVIIFELATKALAKRVRKEGLKQLEKLLSILRIRHHLWTASRLSMAHKTAKFITLFGPCWNESFLL